MRGLYRRGQKTKKFMQKRRVWAEIHKENIQHNYCYTKTLAESAKVIAVVKADAYGHGAAEVSRILGEAGCEMFAVATEDEGVSLRQAGILGDILILGHTPPAFAGTIGEYQLIQTVNSAEYAKALSRSGVKIRTHIKIDTGMSRLGLYCHQEDDIPGVVCEIARMGKLKNLKIEGIFTHFACADDALSPMTGKQYALFAALCRKCASEGVEVGMRHCSNSAAIQYFPEMKLDAVRAGLILYGVTPDGGAPDTNLRPAMRLVSEVVQVSALKPGDTVSYGAAYTANRDIRAAVISIGYADGFSRLLSDKAQVFIKGKRANIIGKICMDMCVADVTEIPCGPGDEVEIFGAAIPVGEQAKHMGTVSYEPLCEISGRVTRLYI